MSRNFIPATLAIGVGIATGYYTFQPALREFQTENTKSQQNQLKDKLQSQQSQEEEQPVSAPAPSSGSPGGGDRT
ncbi:hypothetical protein P175DRAFT_0559112 [Aspergillus ochraceoroseus IBT 24754]|uniref:Uncharacterized protein n=1 Tax=Aspergillus ochraceoroseus IBT 24754 TaxID=1392256 RepID=A0A2T5LTE7_9EURO|nr:uncharacterized protein P175DRAFT_0559112 [Aspergillus ochraceoroseus IBT 24754]PTU19554.1 hypothetical protein P175DRAFT_0559112 [Aspergillus ochraceoroseus IBT 24754]